MKKTADSNFRKIFIVLPILILAAFLVVLYQLLLFEATSITDRECEERLMAVARTFDQARTNTAEDRMIFDRMQERIARMAIWYLDMAGMEVPDKKTLRDLCEALSAEDVCLTDAEGNVLASATWIGLADLSPEDRDSLRGVSEETPISSVVLIEHNEEQPVPEKVAAAHEAGEEIWESCIGIRLAPDRVMVIRSDCSNYGKLRDDTRDWARIFAENTLYENEVFLATDQAGHVIFQTDQQADGSEGGEALTMDREVLQDGWQGNLTLNGKLCRAGTMYDSTDEIYLIAAEDMQDIRAYVLFRMFLIVIPVLIIFLLMYRYGIRKILGLIPDIKRPRQKSSTGTLSWAMGILGVVVTICVCIYAEVLYHYTDQARLNDLLLKVVSEDLDEIEKSQEAAGKLYHHYVEKLTDYAVAVTRHFPACLDSKKLEELTELIGAAHILVYDQSGKVIASDRNYTGLQLSSNPEDLSYEFRWVLYGKPFHIQEDLDETYLDESLRFAGAPTFTEDGDYNGFVQLAFEKSYQGKIVRTTSLARQLKDYNERVPQMVFVVDKDTGIVRSTNEEWDRVSAESLGLTERELRAGFAGFFGIKNDDLFGCCDENSLFYTFVASSTNNVALTCTINGLLNALPALAAELLSVALMLGYARRRRQSGWITEAGKEGEDPDRQLKERWFIGSSPVVFFKRAWMVVATAIFVLVLVRHELFKPGTLMYYLVNVKWAKGPDVFAVTRCIMIAGLISFAAFCINRFIYLFGTLLSSGGQTISTMFSSFIRYACVLLAIYFCADEMGAPAYSLVASASILTLVIGLGAQSLITDILSGLFILFEGMFHVGDIIKINNWRGQVLEIGIRNTQILDLEDNNVKIINNSQIKTLTNYSRYPSYCNMGFTVSSDGDPAAIEEAIDGELPGIAENIPGIVGQIRFLGAEETTGQTVVLTYQAPCSSKEFGKVRRRFERAMIQAFKKHGIQVEKVNNQ